MEILTPIDMQSKVQKMKLIADELRNELLIGVKCLVPKGYTLIVSKDFTHVHKTSENGIHVSYTDYLITMYHTSSAYTTGEKTKPSINLCSKITPNDVYRLNGLIQMLTVDNLSDLVGTTVVGEA